jgi:thioesterase domain-containing protein
MHDRTISDAFLPIVEDAAEESPGGLSAFAEPADRPIVRPRWRRRDEVEVTLMAIWEAVLGTAPPSVDADFFDEGGDSLLAIDLCDHVQRAFGTDLNFNMCIMEPTFAKIAALLRDGSKRRLGRAMIPLRTQGSKPPLFMLPGAGGSIFGYRRFVQHLVPNRPVYGLRLPDAKGPRVAALRIEDLAAYYISKIQHVQPSGPYYLGGYSFGGRIAFEIACQLVARDEKVARLVLFDTYGPGYPKILPAHLRILKHAARFLQLDAVNKRAYLSARLRRLVERYDRVISRVAPGVSYLVPEHIRAEFDWHREASARYHPGIYRGRITLFRAKDEPRALGADYSDPYLGWGSRASGGVEVHGVPGAHVTLFDETNARAVATALSACLS